MKQPRAPKILILGGTGVFGSKLAHMLLQDGWDVSVTSRSFSTAQRFTDAHGGTPVEWDRAQNPAPLFKDHQIVVDAAGPFQDYGEDRCRIALQAIDAGLHYLDLSDDGAFTAGITSLDDLARSKGVTALSGVSSVPALSSAAVSALARDLARIEHIEAAILPGNRAPRGRSVMQAILGQVGAPIRLWRDGAWQSARGWSGSKTYELAPGLSRRAALIGAPDLLLFPDYFGARTVEFRAGLELGWMQSSLALLSWFRARGLMPSVARFTPVFHRVATWFEGAGTDRGGMVVEIRGEIDGSPATRRWTLIAEAGDGPFIPAIPALIAINKLVAGQYTPGARPALAIFSLEEAEKALSRLKVTTRRDA